MGLVFDPRMGIKWHRVHTGREESEMESKKRMEKKEEISEGLEGDAGKVTSDNGCCKGLVTDSHLHPSCKSRELIWDRK